MPNAQCPFVFNHKMAPSNLFRFYFVGVKMIINDMFYKSAILFLSISISVQDNNECSMLNVSIIHITVAPTINRLSTIAITFHFSQIEICSWLHRAQIILTNVECWIPFLLMTDNVKTDVIPNEKAKINGPLSVV